MFSDSTPEMYQQALDNAVKAAAAIYGDKDAVQKGRDAVLKAGIGLGEGLYGYSLEAPAKLLVPALQSWARQIPRKVMPTGLTHQFKRITGVSIRGKATAAEGKRAASAVLATDTQTISLGNMSSGVMPVTYQARYAGGSYEDVLARASMLALLNGMRTECAHIVGGNVDALGVPVVTTSENTTVAGTLVNSQTYYIYVRAMTAMAVQKAMLTKGIARPDAADKSFNAVVTYKPAGTVIYPLIDLTDGYGAPSTVSSVATPAATSSLNISWLPIDGAFGYAIFVGTTAGGGTGITYATFQGVVGQCTVVLKTVDANGIAAIQADTYTDGYGVATTIDTRVDTSADSNDYKGLIAQIFATGSGSHKVNVNDKFSAASGTGIPEINDLLTASYLNQLQTDDVMLVMGPGDQENLNRAFGAGATSSIIRLVAPMSGPEQTSVTGGLFVTKYIHPVTRRIIPIVVDPTWWQGMVLVVPLSFPYPNSAVESPTVVWLQYDWLQLVYAVTEPTQNFENICRGGVAVYAPPAYSIAYNIHNG